MWHLARIRASKFLFNEISHLRRKCFLTEGIRQSIRRLSQGYLTPARGAFSQPRDIRHPDSGREAAFLMEVFACLVRSLEQVHRHPFDGETEGESQEEQSKDCGRHQEYRLTTIARRNLFILNWPPVYTLTRRIIGLVFCLGLCGAVAELRAQRATVSLRLQGEAILVQGQLVWRIDPAGISASDIQVVESTLDAGVRAQCPNIAGGIRSRLLERFAVMKQEESTRSNFTSPLWVLDEANDYTLPAGATLRRFIRGLDPVIFTNADASPPNANPPIGFTRPARLGETLAEHRMATQDWTLWTLDFDLPAVAQTTFAIDVRTVRALADDDAGNPVTTESSTIGAIADDLGHGTLSTDEKAVSVVLGYAPNDLRNADGSPRDRAIVVAGLKAAALKTFLITREEGTGFCQLQDNVVGSKIASRLQEHFLQNSPSSNTALINNVLTIGVPVQFINDVQIKVSAVDSNGNALPQTDRDREIEELINRKYKPLLKARPGAIASSDLIEGDTQQLYLLRSVSTRPTTSVVDGVLTFDVTRRREVMSLALTGKGSYSPEYALNGSLAFTGENLLRHAESLSIELTGGPSFQKGEFKFSLPRENPKLRRAVPIIFAGLNVNAHYLHDNSQLLGKLPDSKLALRESAFSARASFEYDSFTDRDYIQQAEGIDKNRKRLRHFATADIGFDVMTNSFKSTDTIPTFTDSGRVVFPSLTVRYLASYDLRDADKRAGIGEIDFLMRARGQKGLEFLGGDFAYRQYELTAGAQVFFGFSSPADLFLRYQRTVGATGNGAPDFQLFRLGGAQNVRGLEEGELIGSSFATDRTEFGVGLLPIIRGARTLFGRKGDDKNFPTNLAGLDLTNTYIKVFYDRGRTFDEKTLSRILNPAHGVKTLGIAAELRGIGFLGRTRLNLTIGYARSPDSLLHPRGLVVTGVSMDF